MIEDVQAQVQAVADMEAEAAEESQKKRKKKKTLRRSRECLESSRDLGLREDATILPLQCSLTVG